MRPSKWVTPSGLVHRRRIRFWVGKEFVTLTNPDKVITLCGRQRFLRPAPKGAPVTCGVCLKAEKTKAHLRG